MCWEYPHLQQPGPVQPEIPKYNIEWLNVKRVISASLLNSTEDVYIRAAAYTLCKVHSGIIL